MAAPLTGLDRREVWPEPHVCRVCGSARDACRGYPGDVWYCTPCVPPTLRFPHEPGYALPAIEAGPAMTAATPDLFTGFTPA